MKSEYRRTMLTAHRHIVTDISMDAGQVKGRQLNQKMLSVSGKNRFTRTAGMTGTRNARQTNVHLSAMQPGNRAVREVEGFLVDGLYAEGRWQIGLNGSSSPLKLNLSQFERRGLTFDPKSQ